MTEGDTLEATDNINTLESKKTTNKQKPKRLAHKLLTVLLYSIAFTISFYVIGLAEKDKNSSIVLIISVGAILATFGSALSAIGGVWEKDLLERVLINIDVLYKDIIKTEKWRRWPFLPRTTTRKQLDGSKIVQNLSNAYLTFDVGTHQIKIDLPTVLEDFFDLPVWRNAFKIFRFRSASSTTLFNKENDEICIKTGMKPSDEYMAYECVFDIWVSIFKFRLFRYVIHFGSALTISGTINTVMAVVTLNA